MPRIAYSSASRDRTHWTWHPNTRHLTPEMPTSSSCPCPHPEAPSADAPPGSSPASPCASRCSRTSSSSAFDHPWLTLLLRSPRTRILWLQHTRLMPHPLRPDAEEHPKAHG